MKSLLTLSFCAISASSIALADSDAPREPRCPQVYETAKSQVSSDQSKVLEIVSSLVTASPDCSCEVVRGAIEASDSEPAHVAAIVEAAGLAAPQHLRLSAQCAIAVAPGSLSDVQAVVAKLEPNSGESGYSSKGGDSKEASTAKDSASKGVAPVQQSSLDPLVLVDGPPIPPVLFGPISQP